ncbi:hypothetical protein MY04_2471 [Flammeovirga sp. MY04]|uniref:hypothetical protein n=1 Tax=Flammeovirga sp. MY04 TaxID=1191459 RepID=UPI0008062095|nr:hypothetical protein [Flammeovirga sp. MY04]ANQ49843.1 hypothetical protein MY04_2471 [Flammeovirga sp. MY04]
MKKKSYKIDPKYLKEFFSVLFGVMFALFIDTMWSDHEHQELAKKAKRDILIEVKDNLNKIDSLVVVHQKTEEKIRILAKVLDGELDSTNVDRDISLEFELTEDTAWETAKISGAVTYMKLEELSKFNSLYKLQAIYMNNMEKFMEHSFTGMQLLTEKEKLTQMGYFIHSSMTTEKQLIKEYKKVLDENK